MSKSVEKTNLQWSVSVSSRKAFGRKAPALFLALLALPFVLRAQTSDLRGVVIDSTTGQKIPFANVIIVGTSKGAASNIDGFYLIPNLPPGSYDVAASAVGFERSTERAFVRIGEPTVLNFRLSPASVEIGEVVVIGSGKRELTDINTSVHVMDEQDMRAVPVAVQEDVFRSIQILPGIVSASDVNSRFYVRGGAGDQNLILLDGMKVYNPFHAFGVFSAFDSDILKTTEVYTGAFPAGFGGRLSSVVNMTTRDGKATGIAGRADLNFLGSKLELEGPITSGLQFLVTGRKSLFPKTLSRFLGKDTPLSFYDGFFKVSRSTESDSRFGLEGFTSGDDLRSAEPDQPDYRWHTGAFGFTASGLLQDRIFVRTIGYQNTFTASRDPKASTTVTPASTKVNEIGVRVDCTYYTDVQDLYFFGFEFDFPQFEYNLVNTLGAERQLFSAIAESWMWLRYQKSLGRWKVDGGVHVDVASLFGDAVSLNSFQPRVSTSYELFDGWRAKVSYGRFTQKFVTVNNEDDVISLFDAWIKVPDNLSAEHADHYVVGLEGNISRQISTSFQAYYKSYGSLVVYNRDKIDALDPDYISGSGHSVGFETLLRMGFQNLDVYVAYSLGKTLITSQGLTYPPRNDRRHNLNVLVTLRPLDQLEVSARWEYGSGFPFTQTIGYYDRLSFSGDPARAFVGETGDPYSILGPKNASRLPAYHRLDASAVYRFTMHFGFGSLKGEAGLHLINLYDQQNILYFDRTTGKQFNMLRFFPSMTFSVEY